MKKEKLNNNDDLFRVDIEIKSLKNKQEKLLDLKLDEIINEEKYLLKYNQIENEIRELLDQINSVKKDNFELKTQMMLELA